MKYLELREKVQRWKKYKGCKKVDRSPLINAGFSGTFNLSFTEGFWLKEYGRYIDFDHDYIFSTIQSCIRPEDFPLINSKESWRYLGVFEMADLNGVLTLGKRPDFERLLKNQVADLIKLLKEVGIPLNKIHSSYNVGGSVKKITEGRYQFDFKIPEDIFSKNPFLSAGVPKENLIPDSSRDTFLALHVYRPSPWGYRNEISINIGTKKNPKLLDVATIEYTLWKPKFEGDLESKNIVGLEKSKDGFSLVVIGLERLNMAINKLKRVQDVDYILPFYKQWKRFFGKENILACESLRALHRIHSDIIYYNLSLGRHRRKKINQLYRNLPKELTIDTTRKLLEIHTRTQPWHKNLEAGIMPTIKAIEKYKKIAKK